MPDNDVNIIAKKINTISVGRSPITQIKQIGENFAGILDENLHGFLNCISSSIILECEVKRLTQVLEELPVPAMLTTVDVGGCESGALVNIENDLIFHLVDLRMGGDPDVSPSPVARSVTDIDTALCRGFIEILLRCLEEAVSIGLGAPISPILRLNQFEQHVGMVRIAPENADVLLLNISLDIGDAARNGSFDVIMPLSVLDHFIAGAKVAPAEVASAPQTDLWSKHMANAASDSTIKLTSIMHRFKLSASGLKSLRPGQIIPLPPAAKSEVELYMEGAGETSLAVGRLGALDGRKALKLHSPPDATFLKRISGMIEPVD